MTHGTLIVCLKTMVIMVVVFGAFRLTGKRSAGQLNVYDLVTLIALANAVQNAMTGGQGLLSVGIAASMTLILVSWFLGKIFVWKPTLEKRIIGVPTVLVNKGRVKRRALQHEGVTKSELDEAIRLQGLEGVGEVRLAVLEVDGTINVVPYVHKG